jgi:hypothetical protein
VQVPEGVQFPTPGVGSIFEVMESADCATPSNEYIEGNGQSNGFQLIAQSGEEFDAGERGAWCIFSVGSPILVGSVAGQGDRLSSVNGTADVTVTTCEHDQFAATVTNNAATDVAVDVSFSQYFPTGSRFRFTLERIPAGESAGYETIFEEPDTSTPLDCNPFVTTVPVPLGS